MKKLISVLLAVILLTVCSAALADKEATAIGIKTNGLSYEIVDAGVKYWAASGTTNMIFAYVAIKNTDTVPIYLASCSMEYEDDAGHLLGCASRVSNCPDVIDPGEVGYFYISSVNGGFLDDSIDLSNGLNLYAQFTIAQSRETVIPYVVTDTSISFSGKYPVITGRVQNNSEQDDDLLYLNIVLKDQDGKVIWISGTNVADVYAGAHVGFSYKGMYMPPDVNESTIGSFEIIAEPTYYQF